MAVETHHCVPSWYIHIPSSMYIDLYELDPKIIQAILPENMTFIDVEKPTFQSKEIDVVVQHRQEEHSAYFSFTKPLGELAPTEVTLILPLHLR